MVTCHAECNTIQVNPGRFFLLSRINIPPNSLKSLPDSASFLLGPSDDVIHLLQTTGERQPYANDHADSNRPQPKTDREECAKKKERER